MKVTTSKQITRVLILLSILTIVATGVFAQTNSGSITGVIQDQNGAAVANATVTVTNVGTNLTRSAQSESDGRYEIPSLPTGIYKVTATASGFQGATIDSANLAVG